jgi:hypothetical protein
MSTTLLRPVLLIDEAQEMRADVLNELRLLTGKEFDFRSLLSVVFAGDERLLTQAMQASITAKEKEKSEVGPGSRRHATGPRWKKRSGTERKRRGPGRRMA